jgi:photosystem II stability/assembly factor-like uncharacterized protein
MCRALWISGLALALSVTACGQRSDTIVSIALHPAKPNIVYVATDEAVYKSSDTGATWTRLEGELSRTGVISLALDPQLPATVFAGTMGDGTYKSPDGGKNLASIQCRNSKRHDLGYCQSDCV